MTSRRLTILRHGQAEQPIASKPDRKRELTIDGERDAERVGAALWRRDLRPAVVLSSDATRARTTAEKAVKAAGLTTSAIRITPSIYEASLGELIELAREATRESDRVMIVGHNPGLSGLASRLSGELIRLRPASVAVLEFTETIESARLVWSEHADGLPRQFGYPDPSGSELRDRPAYYYTQAAAMPYRVGSGSIEVLVIGSHKKKRHVIPTGVVEPGLSPAQSAAQKAALEAGVRGLVDDMPLGTCELKKWGALCSCSVLPMLVEDVIPAAAWRENDRGRQWMAPEDAKRLLKSPFDDFVDQLLARLTG